MDLNYLYHRQQVSRMRADRAACDLSRAAHEGLARLYEGAIDARKGVQRTERVARDRIGAEMVGA